MESHNVLKVRVVTQLGLFCRLPAWAIRVHLPAGSIAVAEVMDKSSDETVYFAWNGERSETECIELPPGELRTVGYRFSPLNGSYCILVGLQVVLKAQEVFLKPVSLADWEIISTQAGYVEENMLKSHCILFIGQVVRVHMGASLFACLVVTAVKTAGLQSPEVRAVHINNESMLIIEPFQPPAGVDHVETTSAAASINWEALDYESKSHQQVLFVLPQHHAAHDSSYRTSAVISDDAAHDCGSDLGLNEAYLADFLSESPADSVPNREVPAGLLPLPEDDHSTCIVHPLFLLACFEAALRFKIDLTQWGETENYLSGKTLIACVERCTRSAASVDPPTPHAVVHVRTSVHVRPGCCLLSSSVRAGMLLEDYETVRVYLVTKVLGGTVLPHSVTLRQRFDGSATDQGQLCTAEGARTALSGLIARAHRQNRPFILHDKQVLSVTAPILVHEELEEPDAPSSSNVDYTGESIQGLSLQLRRTEFIVTLDSKRVTTEGIPATVILPPGSPQQLVDSLLEVVTVERSGEGDEASAERSGGGADTRVNCQARIIGQYTATERQTARTGRLDVARLFPKAVQALMRAILPALLPTAVHSAIQAGVAASHWACLLTGGVGSGKTSLLMEVGELLHQNLRTQTHTAYINAADLKTKALEYVIEKLSEVFAVARAYPTALLLIDNLDALCPSGKENGMGTLRDDRSCIISLHLQQLLGEIHTRQSERLRAATETFQCKGVDESLARPFVGDQVALAATGAGTMFILASAQSPDAVSPVLLSHDCFASAIEIESLSDRRKVVALDSALESFQAKLEPLSLSQTELVASAMQGYCLRDIGIVAKRACFASIRNKDVSAIGKPLVVRHEDVLQAAHEHVSVCSPGGVAPAVTSTVGSGLRLVDVPGYEDAKKVILDTLRTPLIFARLYQQCPTKMPRSVLLYGPPGCGKTLLAQAAGREFGQGFISVRGPELLNKYIGASEAAVRALFQRARDAQRPCLIFFDEFESLAPRRGKDNTGVTDRVVNQLLTFIDGVESTMAAPTSHSHDGEDSDSDAEADNGAGQIFIVAATSRPDLVDPALLRPGRIEKHVYVGLPVAEVRRAILLSTLQSVSSDGAVPDGLVTAVDEIARDPKAATFSPADLKAVVNTAYLAAIHEHIDALAATGDGFSAQVKETTPMPKGVRVSPVHIRQAFHSTRASITAADLRQLTDTYRRFSKHALPDAPKPAQATDETDRSDVDKAQRQSYF